MSHQRALVNGLPVGIKCRNDGIAGRVKAAHYVGRVGTLAMALGIGAAMFAGTGVARADDDATSSAAPSSSASPKRAVATSPARRSAAAPRPARSSIGSNTAPATAQPVTTADSAPPATPASAAQRVSRASTATVPAGSAAKAGTATVAQSGAASTQEVASVAAESAPPVAASATAGSISSALASSTTPTTPTSPTEIPTLPALLAGAVRDLERTFMNKSPVISGYTQTGQTVSADGKTVTITGKVNAADPEGDPLIYSVLGGSARGGTATVDQAGNYTYTGAFTPDLGSYDDFNVIVNEANAGTHFRGVTDFLSRIPVIGSLFGGPDPAYGDGGTSVRVAVSAVPTEATVVATGSGATLSSTPITTRTDWQQYVLTPQGCSTAAPCTATPTSIYYKNADVTANADGTVTLNYTQGGQAPVVIFDYGREVGGYSQYNIVSSSVPTTLKSAYSETYYNMSPTGDGAFSASILADSGSGTTAEEHQVAGPGVITGSLIQGGYRYQRVTLTAPGSVTLSVATDVIAPLKSADEYGGNFLSNSDLLNRIWYAGAYTINIDEIPAGTPANSGTYDLSILAEAAKRDRAIWAGDLQTALPTLSTVFGADGTALARNNLTIMGNNPQSILFPVFFPSLDTGTGPAALPGVCKGTSASGCSFYSATYSMNYVANMRDYYHSTGDVAFIADNWNTVQRELAYEQSLVNPDTGLVDVPFLQSLDWSLTVRPGTQTAANVLHYRSLTSAAEMATALAGNTADGVQKTQYLTEANAYTQQAAYLKQKINDTLWNESLGAYDASTDQRGLVTQDANTWAMLYGVADAQQSARIAQTMVDALGTEYGLRIADPSIANTNLILINLGYPAITSPFASSFTLNAYYQAGRPDLAMNLITQMWGHMVNSDAGSTTWERIQLPGGNLSAGGNLQSDSASHAWGTGATAALSEYVAGITPVGAGYSTWQVKPYTQGATWAQGRVPIPDSADGQPRSISSAWETGATDANGNPQSFRLTVTSPDSTTGIVAVPTLGATDRNIYMDGRLVWNASAAPGQRNTGAIAGVTATDSGDGYVTFTGSSLTGTHTWAWSTTPA